MFEVLLSLQDICTVLINDLQKAIRRKQDVKHLNRVEFLQLFFVLSNCEHVSECSRLASHEVCRFFLCALDFKLLKVQMMRVCFQRRQVWPLIVKRWQCVLQVQIHVGQLSLLLMVLLETPSFTFLDFQTLLLKFFQVGAAFLCEPSLVDEDTLLRDDFRSFLEQFRFESF